MADNREGAKVRTGSARAFVPCAACCVPRRAPPRARLAPPVSGDSARSVRRRRAGRGRWSSRRATSARGAQRRRRRRRPRAPCRRGQRAPSRPCWPCCCCSSSAAGPPRRASRGSRTPGPRPRHTSRRARRAPASSAARAGWAWASSPSGWSRSASWAVWASFRWAFSPSASLALGSSRSGTLRAASGRGARTRGGCSGARYRPPVPAPPPPLVLRRVPLSMSFSHALYALLSCTVLGALGLDRRRQDGSRLQSAASDAKDARRGDAGPVARLT